MIKIFALGIILLHLVVSVMSLQNITCGCLAYDWFEIRCYHTVPNCSVTYFGGQYAQYLLLQDYVLPTIFKNDFQLQQLILDLQSRTNSNIANSIQQGKIQILSFISNMSDIYTQQFNELRDSITALKNLQSFKSEMIKQELSGSISLQGGQVREIREKVIGQNWFQEYYREVLIGVLILAVMVLVGWGVLLQRQVNEINSVMRMLKKREDAVISNSTQINLDKQLSSQRVSSKQTTKQHFSLPQQQPNTFLQTSH